MGLRSLLPEEAFGPSPNYIGGLVWFLPVAAVVLALVLRRWSDAAFVVLAGVTALFVGYVLKFLVARPRPPAEFNRLAEEGYGFPSSTTLIVVVILGTACYLVRRAPRPVFVCVLAVSAVLALAVGLSRVYAGEHWASDVLGSYLFGLALVLVLIPVRRRWSEAEARPRAGEGSRPGPG